MERAAWNQWANTVNNSSFAEINDQISSLEADKNISYIEKNIKLGYLYFSKNYLGTATNIFYNIKKTIFENKNNFEFLNKNKDDINIMLSEWKVTPDGRGGYSVSEVGDILAPICCCCGILGVIAICRCEPDSICTFDSDTGKSGGCIGYSVDYCCGTVFGCLGC